MNMTSAAFLPSLSWPAESAIDEHMKRIAATIRHAVAILVLGAFIRRIKARRKYKVPMILILSLHCTNGMAKSMVLAAGSLHRLQANKT